MSKWVHQMIETSRGNFEVFTKGKGEPVCVTHHYSEFDDSGDYFANTFTSTNKVFLVNLRDAGNTDKPSSPHELSMIDAVLDLESIRQAYGYERWTFAGHSTGGMIGLLYGIHFSESLKSLIIVGSSAREFSSSSTKCIYNEEHPNYERMQELMQLLKNPLLTIKERYQLSKERTQFSLYRPDNYESFFSSNIHKKICASRLNFFGREALIYDVTRQLDKVKTSVHILCGRHDVQCPVEFSLEMHEILEYSTLDIFEQSNHYPFIEEKELFTQVINRFLVE